MTISVRSAFCLSRRAVAQMSIIIGFGDPTYMRVADDPSIRAAHPGGELSQCLL